LEDTNFDKGSPLYRIIKFFHLINYKV